MHLVTPACVARRVPGEVSLALPNTDVTFEPITGLPGEPAEKLAIILRSLQAEGSNQ